jgi:hypothetical protein
MSFKAYHLSEERSLRLQVGEEGSGKRSSRNGGSSGSTCRRPAGRTFT